MKGDTLKAGEYSASKKVLIATGIYPPDIGGPATYSKQLFDHLPLHGISVNLVSFSGVRSLPRGLRHFIYFLKLLKAGRSSDVIFAQDPVSVGLPACLASKILKKKFILKIVGDYAWEQFQNQNAKIKNQNNNVKFIKIEEFQEGKYDFTTEIRRKIQKRVAGRASKIIVPSNYLKKIILKWGVSEDKISVIYNSFDFSSVLEGKDEIRREYSLSGKIIISIGRLVPWKGFGALIEAMPDILKNNSDARLLIIGDGPEKENLTDKIVSLDIQDKVIMTGKLPHEELLAYLKASDVFVLNTAYEGFSHQLLEVMALGVPIVTTDIGGNAEIIEDNKNGVFIELNNKNDIKMAVLRLLSDKELCSRLAEEGKRTAGYFSKEKMINETIKILT